MHAGAARGMVDRDSRQGGASPLFFYPHQLA